MEPYYSDDQVTLWHGDALDVLRSLPEASVDAVVTDPPYGLEFMGKEWDGADGFRRSLNLADAGRDNAFGRTSRTSPEYRAGRVFGDWCNLWAAECLRVLKPGGHMLAFGGTRTWHRLACAVEDAGFEVRDSIAWLYGSGFPKSLDVSKAIDKAAGAERDVLGVMPDRWTGKGNTLNFATDRPQAEVSITGAPATPDAERWQGWGTALKPAFEPIVVARKPLTGTVAANVLAHGTGALNVDGCRVEASGRPLIESKSEVSVSTFGDGLNGSRHAGSTDLGRWPANVILDDSQAEALDAQSGESVTGGGPLRRNTALGVMNDDGWEPRSQEGNRYPGEGGASRFFYVAQPDAQPIGDDELWRNAAATAVGRPTKSGTDATVPSAALPPVPPSHVRSPQTDGAQATPPAKAPLTAEIGPRFFYVAKADASERVRINGTAHPTVKPLALMRWLVRLVTPPGGTVLEPFAGSGTTVEACILEGFDCIAIEREADYLPLVTQRIHRRRNPVAAVKATDDDGGLFDLLDGGVA